jgi:hypothetical protein
MTDRELLEAAAKAAGIEGEVEEFYLHLGDKEPILAIGTDDGAWAPLTDDGDALRLAVRLHIATGTTAQSAWSENASGHEVIVGAEECAGDLCAAARRAIVRAAAATISGTYPSNDQPTVQDFEIRTKDQP